MPELAIIGGTGLTSLHNLHIVRREVVHTPYGEPSGPLTYGELGGKEVVFLPRHGSGHNIPPHRINYRANISALKETGVTKVIAVAAVGGIRTDMVPGRLVVPDQIIDYTWSRANTFFEDGLTHVTHVDFTYPYSNDLRDLIIKAAKAARLDIAEEGTYGATQGPRLETAAEINRLESDGCTIVGMTGMPEAVLARELDLSYATCAVIANMAAGRGDGVITMREIEQHLKSGMENVRTLLEHLVPLL
ncbi:MAG: 5'-methylthioadenosine phosphorylase [Gammaproteobacteria bacterium]|nr:MAG: 5'-methylthioadenosine phosphorylase [Gammaproteobacteria bacterium]TND07004.1 MAG: 5'-methylthioadenosine phosphorylase [Gammaproteobacteria bacterium]